MNSTIKPQFCILLDKHTHTDSITLCTHLWLNTVKGPHTSHHNQLWSYLLVFKVMLPVLFLLLCLFPSFCMSFSSALLVPALSASCFSSSTCWWFSSICFWPRSIINRTISIHWIQFKDWREKECREAYGGTFLLWTPLGQLKVSWLERYPHLRGACPYREVIM